MASSNRVLWETDLRKSIRSNYGQGWTVIGEDSGRTKYNLRISKRWEKVI